MVPQKLSGTDVNTLLVIKFLRTNNQDVLQNHFDFLTFKRVAKKKNTDEETILDAVLTVSILIANSPPTLLMGSQSQNLCGGGEGYVYRKLPLISPPVIGPSTCKPKNTFDK